jgi:hypothetical protein
MWRLQVFAKTIHFAHVWVGLTYIPTLSVDGWANLCYCCLSWANLYYHFKCWWLGQSMLLLPLPRLGRSLENNYVIPGQDVSPCAQKVPSSWKFTPICTSSNLNYTSLDVAKMDATLRLWYWISMPFYISYWCSNFHLIFNLTLIGVIPFLTIGMTMLLVYLQIHFHVPRFEFLHSFFLFFNNSIAFHSTFFACDFIFCRCPYNSMNFSMDFSHGTCVYVWCSTSSPNPHFSMMFVWHHWS